MTGSMIASAIPFAASAAATNPLGLKMTSAKTEFTMDEIRNGASATVYIDPTGSVSASQHVGSVEFKLKSSAWGKVDPVDLYLSNPNILETDKGSEPKKAYNATGTMVISKWEGTKPSKPGYTLQDFANVDTFPGTYSDQYCPAVVAISDSGKGFMRTGSEGEHFAQFTVNFPRDLAAGDYTINFVDAKSMICTDGEFGSNNSENVSSPTATGITFKVGVAASTTTRNPEDEPDRIYDGDCTITVKEVEGAVGDEVDVPVYFDFGSNVNLKYITGIGFKVNYDKSKLELVDMSDDAGFISDGAFNSDTGTGVFMYTFSTENIEIDPSKPIGYFTFKIKEGASGRIPVTLSNHLHDGWTVQVIHKQNKGEDTTYLKPTIVNGAVTVKEKEVSTTPTTIATTTEPVVVTSIQPVTSIVPVESIVPVTSYVPTVSYDVKESIVTNIVPVESIVPVTSFVPTVSYDVKESIVTNIVPVESIVPVETIVPVTSFVPTVSYDVKESIVPVTSYVPVETMVVVTSIDPVKETVIVVSEVTVIITTTTTEPIATEPVQTSVSFSIPGGGADVEDDDSQWYYADETTWHLEGVKVFVDGVELTEYNPEDLIVTLEGKEATPANVYNGKDFNYTLTIQFMGAEDTFNAKIGKRGDANTDHNVNVRDAAAIAKDLANLYKLKKSSFTKWAMFLANSDAGKNGKAEYAPYDVNVRDAAVIAKYLANTKKYPTATLLDWILGKVK